MAKIYLASKDVALTSSGLGPAEHSYWVFDPDGDPTSGDERIIRGGPANSSDQRYLIEVDRPIEDSRDELDGDDPYGDRWYTTVFEGTEEQAQSLWDDAIERAKQLGEKDEDPLPVLDDNGDPYDAYFLPETDYWLTGPNCHCVTNTVGQAMDIDLGETLPKVGGDTGNGETPSIPDLQFLGRDMIIGTTGDENIDVDSDNPKYFDQGGNDTYNIDASDLQGTNGPIIILEDTDASTTDKVVLTGYDPQDVTLTRDPLTDDLLIHTPDGVIVLDKQFDGGGTPRLNILEVEPLGGGTPISIPLNNPETFPSYFDPVDKPISVEDLLDKWGEVEATGTPLVFDLDGDGIELAASTSAEAVYWDIDEDGFGEASGWITGGDGLLAIDLNADGIINDHSELFGTLTTDGFTVLSAYDSNSDNVIDSSDTQFNDLRMWVDSNADGYSQSAELYSLSDLGITSIDLNASLVDYDIAGNHITHESTFTINGQTQTVVDAWFAYDNTNSIFQGEYDRDVRTLYIPKLRGFGDVKDLDIAMSMDETLLDMVWDVAIADTNALFDPAFDLEGKMIDIAYRWAGVDGVDPTSRGAQIDARTLEFFEQFFGDDYYQDQISSANPNLQAATVLNDMFEQVISNMTLSIMMQTDKASFFDTGAEYDAVSGEMQNVNGVYDWRLFGDDVTNEDNVYQLGDNSGTVNIDEFNNTNFDQLWVSGNAEDARTWIDGLGYLHVQLGETSTNKAIVSAQSPAAGSDVHTRLEEVRFEDGTVWDLTQNLILTDLDTGNSLNGSSGADILTGRGGNDHLYGKEGNDIYVWSVGDGNDIIDEGGGTDQLVLHGVVEDDIRLEVYNQNDLKINIGTESIVLTFQFFSMNYNNSYYDLYHVESLLLDDGTTIDLLNNLTFKGTDAAETINATKANDILIGGLGNDTLNGKEGDDQYVWSVGDGDDSISETGGVDQLVLHGVTEDDIRFEVLYGTDLKVHVGSEVISVSYQFASSQYNSSVYDQYQVESLLLDDGTTIDLLNNLAFEGTDAAETVNGLKTNDILIGGLGNDTLNGKEGDDQYVWSVGDGNDYINEAGGTDQLVLHGVISDDIRLEVQYSTNLNVHIGNETITLANHLMSSYYNSSSYDVYQIESIALDDGSTIDLLNNLTFKGTSGNDTINGTKMSDTLDGLAGSDYLYAGDGDDVLYGGAGIDMLYGQAGADTFVFDDTASSDNIQDFDLTAGDKLDISDLLIGYDPLTDAITDFVQITETSGNSYLNVDVDGGADNFVQVAYIYNETGLTDEEALETSGSLIAA
ncbi:MAG: calcium-binding protein [Candidatus Thiodiazotropha sp. (ex Lucina aurantia)]|nr:calcium-binding protein [Candidatus Thiodiazotropha taylori]MBV2097816.1 calcium-binding protein [Candidatus Thiodiazotropha sp. (ex Codakia orbicularis)]MBV2103311.1 calcium-binding protein [Candidatus Thiodiazotropha sp. (ex Lucina aurantia)]MBV2116326.1 calcium-binding protein [Candidatus Thiodiazotropha sp. (ex Lucina aurantia)]